MFSFPNFVLFTCDLYRFIQVYYFIDLYKHMTTCNNMCPPLQNSSLAADVSSDIAYNRLLVMFYHQGNPNCCILQLTFILSQRHCALSVYFNTPNSGFKWTSGIWCIAKDVGKKVGSLYRTSMYLTPHIIV